MKDLENGSGGGGAGAKDDHESAETGGCDEDDEKLIMGDVDHESAKGPSAADDASVGEEMVTAAEDDPTDPGLSIPEQEEAVAEADDGDLAGKRSGNGPSSSLVVAAAAANNKHLNSVSTCSELSEDELYQDVDSGDAATDQEKERLGSSRNLSHPGIRLV